MSNIDLNIYKDIAEKAMLEASDLLIGKFRPEKPSELKRFYKSVNALVTDADLASDKKISENLNDSRLKANIYSEESKKTIDENSNLFG